MEPFDAYKIYQSLKLHYTSDSYDAVRYNYKTNTTAQAYLKRKDKFKFAKAAKEYKTRDALVEYYVANFVCGEEWVGNFNEENLKYWQHYSQSMKYRFQLDLTTLEEAGGDKWFDEALTPFDGDMPPAVTYYVRGEIHLITLCILDQLTNFCKKADKKITETLVWPYKYKMISKTNAFISFDKRVYKNIIIKE